MFPLKRKLYSSYTCTAVSHTAPRDSPPDHLCQEDFRYKEPVPPFVEPSALIPLLGHHEGGVGGSFTLGSRTTSQDPYHGPGQATRLSFSVSEESSSIKFGKYI
ncbi:unnamed protein product [Trifolium pratense]|uniref:Uncharacterized protein n=1 Tax=Trifolium pratense TaxID=57577 RepID=A0ACB0K9D0_TRIPR|nr:unnamed protein product [Trifolium pratense]